MLREHPRTMLPFVVTQVPVVLLGAGASAALYATVFSEDEPFQDTNDLFRDGPSGPLFAFLVIQAVSLLFSLVGTTATMLAVESAAGSKPQPLSASLDRPFSRMGGLLALFAVFALIIVSGALLVTLVAIPYVLVRLAVAFNALISENLAPRAALERSWRLMKGNILRFLVLTLALLPAALLVFVVNSLSWGDEESARSTQLTSETVRVVVGGVLSIPFLTFITATTTIFYLKIRTAFDERAHAAGV